MGMFPTEEEEMYWADSINSFDGPESEYKMGMLPTEEEEMYWVDSLNSFDECFWDGEAHIDFQDGWYLRVTYNKGFIEALKAGVPSSGRRWDSQTQRWWIAEKFYDLVEQLCETHFGQKPG